MNIEALRAANQAKLLGLKANKDVKIITPSSVSEQADDAWIVISLVTKKATIIDKNGKPRAGKERKYADEFPIEDTVGKLASSKNREGVKRTNISTMREMYTFRNKIVKYAVSEQTDSYAQYFQDLLVDLDVYAQMVVADMYEADSELFDKVNKILNQEDEAMKKNLEEAREARN